MTHRDPPDIDTLNDTLRRIVGTHDALKRGIPVAAALAGMKRCRCGAYTTGNTLATCSTCLARRKRKAASDQVLLGHPHDVLALRMAWDARTLQRRYAVESR